MTRRRLVPYLSLLLAAQAALAEVKTHPTAKVSIDVPKEWTQKTDGDKMMCLDPKGDVLVAMRVLEATELKAAADKVDSQVADLVFDLTWQQKQDRNVNGLTAAPTGDRIPLDPHTWPDAYAICAIDITPEGRTFVLGLSDTRTTAQVLGEIDLTTSTIRTLTPIDFVTTDSPHWGLAVEPLGRRPH